MHRSSRATSRESKSAIRPQSQPTPGPDDRSPGRVSFIQPQVDDTTRTLKVRLEIPNPKGQLSPGMFVNVSLDSPLGRQLTIPASGVFQSGTRQIAFVDRGGGYFEPREVETGERAGR